MRRNEENWLGDGFEPLEFWVFNSFMISTWIALQVLQVYAIIGIGYVIDTGTPEISASVLGQLGGAFINLTYGLSVLFLATLLLLTWFFGNVYITRKELYEILKTYFRWGDL